MKPIGTVDTIDQSGCKVHPINKLFQLFFFPNVEEKNCHLKQLLSPQEQLKQ